jgi:hypothetical protein
MVRHAIKETEISRLRNEINIGGGEPSNELGESFGT